MNIQNNTKVAYLTFEEKKEIELQISTARKFLFNANKVLKDNNLCVTYITDNLLVAKDRIINLINDLSL